MAKYVDHIIVDPGDLTLDDAAVGRVLAQQFVVGAKLTVLGRPRVVMYSVFESDEKNPRWQVAADELHAALRIGDECMLDSSEGPAFPNHPVKFTCVKRPGHQLGKIVIGDNVCLQGTAICSYESVAIGNNVIFAPGVVIMDCSGHGLTGRNAPGEVAALEVAPVVIEENVWVGYGAIILPGVTIGTGAVIGAGSVVTRNIPAACAAAGNPCKVIKSLH
jgi:acetyltransferase-like isoleucine patch superfamily enzyme